MQRRLGEASAEQSRDAAVPSVISLLTAGVDERKFGIDTAIRTKLRRELIRAGFFAEDALRVYIIARIVAVVALPVLAFAILKLSSPNAPSYLLLAATACAAFVGLFGVDAYLSRRQGRLRFEYRTIFPDLIDMLVVCVDAGLSLDAAIVRVTPEIGRRSQALRTNLTLLTAETRAGRSTADALSSFSDRLNLDEVRAFSILLRQSFELGTDIADALRVFADEMRTKRLLRAEEIANKLPVKMVLPLGLCIFPVILMVVMVPVVIRLLFVFHNY
jgi:tight adherence protein C